MPLSDLYSIHQRLRLERARLDAQLAPLERQRAALFERAVHESSSRIQTALARKLREMDARMAGLYAARRALDLQSALLGQLRYAQENDDPPDRGLLAQIDWDVMLASINEWRVTEAAMLEKLQGVLDTLAPPVVPSSRSEVQSPKSKVESPRSKVESPQPPDFTPHASHLTPPPPSVEWELVVSVPDGDGLKLDDGRKVRYIGMDTPEMARWKHPTQPFAIEAREFNKALVVGKRVRLERDTSDTDRYGRLLRYVYVGDTLVNAELLKAGLARVFTVWPDVARAAEFERLEKEARRKHKGMWKA